jgi:acetyl-CoA acetyltransferase
MIPFTKPGASEPYDVMGAAATRAALADAGIDYSDVEQAFVGYVYGDSTAGQKTLYHVGMTGIPVFNVNNNCSTGSTALFLARQAVESGVVDCALALGFEQMVPGALTAQFKDRPTPFDDFDRETAELVGQPDVPLAIRYFGGAGASHMKKYGTRLETFARVRAKASRHGAKQSIGAIPQGGFGRRGDGLADDHGRCHDALDGLPADLRRGRRRLWSRMHSRADAGCRPRVSIAAQAMTTDSPSTFDAHDMMQLVGYDMTRAAVAQVFDAAGIGPDDVDVVELHDCFAQNELISYEALGLCPEGGAEKFVDDGDNTYGGKVVTNPSGGLLSKGHPLGATGLAQCFELTQQLRGNAERRQVDGARLGLQHNLGLGGACVVTLYRAG